MSVWTWAVGAHLAWKPLLVFHAAFLLYVIVRARRGSAVPRERVRFGGAWLAAVLLLTALVYLPSLGANFVRFDWTHRMTTQPATGVSYFFVAPQPDRFYRPLGLVSLWIDNRLFGPSLWPYHLQNIGLHALNAVLVGWLAAGLGFSRWSSRFAALLFGVGAVRFEPVVWPGARFDLLAAAFSLIALLLFLRFWPSDRGVVVWGAGVVLAFVAAVLCKESAYSVLLVIPLLMLPAAAFRRLDPPESGSAARIGRPTRAVWLLLSLVVCTGALLAIRFRLYGGVGGYPGQTGFGLRTLYLFVRNSLAGSIFGLNDVPHSGWPLLIAVAFVVVMLRVAALYRGVDRSRLLTLMALTLASAIPALTLVGWLNPGFENSRYLYWPSVWMCMLLALVFESSRSRTVVACAFLAVQAAGALWNESVYRELSEKARTIAAEVRGDAAGRAISAVQFLNIGSSEDGVFAFGPELEAQTRALVPRATVETCPSACLVQDPRNTLIYRWDESSRTMERLR